MLIIKNLKASINNKDILKGLNLNINPGEVHAIMGPNGSGKSTLANILSGKSGYEISGELKYNGENLNDIPVEQRAQKGIGYLAQEESVFRKLSVEDNILGVLEFSELSKNQQKEKAEQLMEEFGLINIRRNRGDLLSGGERRRTEIARALANNPNFLLLDEPFAGVDPIAVEDIQSIISVLKKKNIGILITDHNVQETLAITDRTYLMFEGKILKEGVPEDLAKDEMVRKVYLGKNFEFKRKKI